MRTQMLDERDLECAPAAPADAWIQRRSGLTAAEFRPRYLLQRRPVVSSGAPRGRRAQAVALASCLRPPGPSLHAAEAPGAYRGSDWRAA